LKSVINQSLTLVLSHPAALIIGHHH